MIALRCEDLVSAMPEHPHKWWPLCRTMVSRIGKITAAKLVYLGFVTLLAHVGHAISLEKDEQRQRIERQNFLRQCQLRVLRRELTLNKPLAKT